MWGFFPMCGFEVRKRAFGPQKPKQPFGWIFQNLVFFFHHDHVWCSGDLELQWHVKETIFLCAWSIRWESVISLPSQVVSGSLLRLLKFLPVFKLAVRFAAGSALIRRACLPWLGERSWSLRATEHSPCVLLALRHGAKFHGEARLALFLLPRCGFPVVCYSQRVFDMFKSSVTAQEELNRTQRLPLQSTYNSIYSTPLPADLISAPALAWRFTAHV